MGPLRDRTLPYTGEASRNQSVPPERNEEDVEDTRSLRVDRKVSRSGLPGSDTGRGMNGTDCDVRRRGGKEVVPCQRSRREGL